MEFSSGLTASLGRIASIHLKLGLSAGPTLNIIIVADKQKGKVATGIPHTRKIPRTLLENSLFKPKKKKIHPCNTVANNPVTPAKIIEAKLGLTNIPPTAIAASTALYPHKPALISGAGAPIRTAAEEPRKEPKREQNAEIREQKQRPKRTRRPLREKRIL